MSDRPESPQPAPVPYQAYRSKRQSHSRNVSISRLTPSASPPPTAPATNVVGIIGYDSWEKEAQHAFTLAANQSPPMVLLQPSSPKSNGLPSPPESPSTVDVPEPMKTLQANGDDKISSNGDATPIENNEPTSAEVDIPPTTTPSSPTASSSGSPSHANKSLPRLNTGRKTSTFRHVPRTRPGIPSSPLAPQSHSRNVSTPTIPSSNLRHSMPPLDNPPSFSTAQPNRLSIVEPRTRVVSPSPLSKPLPSSPIHTNGTGNTLVTPQPHHPSASLPVSPPTRTSSLHPSPTASPVRAPNSISPSPSHHAAPPPSRSATATPPYARSPAPYRPGFQPKGVYRPRTDEFISLRKLARDGVESAGRIERTKLERRLEKIIALHFPLGGKSEHNEHLRPGGNRRASSFFDIDLGDLKRMSMSDAGGLWKGVLAAGAGKNDMRAAEQRITPWEDDASVSKCPMCSASFHPLTNRKHHCRLCGQIICSLPIKNPQRSALCSVLFVVDPKTRRIEEVGEGVDYGVRRRRTNSMNGPPGKRPVQDDDEAEKFLKGVRICRGCRPILLRQQYQQEMSVVPTFSHLYEVLVELEKELEDSLPQFQEMLVSLNQDDHPTKEASAARKRLLEVFAQYDSVAKRIRKLPCPAGGSQDRVQLAVATRANVFLQKHMFPLQSLPKPKAKHKKSSSKADDAGLAIDPDSEMAMALQPLLEQEALLESFVEEARAHRKFEDAKTLQLNLSEIRGEIERILANADDGAVTGKGKGKKTK